MKNYRQVILLVLALSAGASQWGYGQATYGFQNAFGSGLNAPVFDSGGVRLFGTNYVAVLYGGPTADSLAIGQDYDTRAPMTPEPFDLLRLGLAGYFDGGIVEIPSVNCGGIATLQVRAWDVRLGASYEEVVALGGGGYGASPIFQKRGGLGVLCLVNPTPPEPLIGLQSFSLVPEPSPLFFIALGLPLLFLFLRRRSRRVV